MVRPPKYGRRVPELDGGAYITLVAELDMWVHMLMVDCPTDVIALSAARNIKASISPYSTAVAALVDRSSP